MLWLIYDNLKTVVDAIFAGKERQFNWRFLTLANLICLSLWHAHQNPAGKKVRSVLEKKLGTLRHGAPFQQWDLPTPIQIVRDRILKQDKGDRAFVELLLMARALGEAGLEMLEVACDDLANRHYCHRHCYLNYPLHAAKFPHHRDLIHFDWTENSLTKGRIEQLATGEFMIQANNLIFVGDTGTVKTHLAIALAVSAIHHGKRVRFYNAVDLVNQLEKKKQLANLVLWPSDSCRSMPLSSTNWATCHSQNPVTLCCFISLVSCMRKPL